MNKIFTFISLFFVTGLTYSQSIEYCQTGSTRSSNCFNLKPTNDELTKGSFMHVLFMDDQQIWYGIGKYKTKKSGALVFKYKQKDVKPKLTQEAGLNDMIQLKWASLFGEQDFFQIRITVNGVVKSYDSDINTRTVSIPVAEFEAIKDKNNAVSFSLYYHSEKVMDFTWISGKGNAVLLQAYTPKTHRMDAKKALLTKAKEGYVFYDAQRKENFTFVQRAN